MKVRKILSLFLVLSFSQVSLAQNLLQERIWKISSKKRSIFFDKGIFHAAGNSSAQRLTGMRSSYVAARKYERIVFDFSSNRPPKVYGHISNVSNKVYVDFFNTSLEKSLESLKNIKFIKNVDFFNLDANKLSVEMSFVDGASYDIFYLENPGRLVIDVKK
jgi:hypothetical protein